MIAVAVSLIAFDQVTKQLVLDRLGPEGDTEIVRIIPGVLRFLYVENTGAAFGFFRGNSALLTVLALAVVATLIVYFRHAIARNSWLALALGLQIGGAFGNIIDRLRHGFVVDFIDVPRWPTFNVADSGITVGVVILGVYLFFRESESEAPDTADRPPDESDRIGPAHHSITENAETSESR